MHDFSEVITPLASFGKGALRKHTAHVSVLVARDLVSLCHHDSIVSEVHDLI